MTKEKARLKGRLQLELLTLRNPNLLQLDLVMPAQRLNPGINGLNPGQTHGGLKAGMMIDGPYLHAMSIQTMDMENPFLGWQQR